MYAVPQANLIWSLSFSLRQKIIFQHVTELVTGPRQLLASLMAAMEQDQVMVQPHIPRPSESFFQVSRLGDPGSLSCSVLSPSIVLSVVTKVLRLLLSHVPRLLLHLSIPTLATMVYGLPQALHPRLHHHKNS